MTDAPANVVSLRGVPLPQPGAPDEDVVEAVKEILVLAESGQIKGIAAAFVWNDDAVGWRLRGARGYTLSGALQQIQHRICVGMDEE